jgi:DNA-binding NarL/FixJ family response regulator
MSFVASSRDPNTLLSARVLIIRVLCVDDSITVRHSLTLALSAYDDMEMVGAAASGEEAMSLCEVLAPHVVLMDILMPGMGGVAATRAIRERWPAIRVVGLTSSADRASHQEILQAGARSCLIKRGSSSELVAAIREAFYSSADRAQ